MARFDPALQAILVRMRALVYEVVPAAAADIKWRASTLSLQKTRCYSLLPFRKGIVNLDPLRLSGQRISYQEG